MSDAPCPAPAAPLSLPELHAAGRLAVATMGRLASPEGITLPTCAAPVLALLPDPPARRIKPSPLPQWEAGEHTYLGDHITLHFDGHSGMAKNIELHLDNTLKLTYGQIVALGGDFYGLPDDPISDDPSPPHRFRQAYRTLAVAHDAVGEVPKILAVMRIEINAVNQAIRQGRQPSTAYAALGDELSGQWNRITGGGSDVSALLPPGRYLKLAATNWDHFGTHAITCYKIGHGVAMQAAIAARAASDPAMRQTLLERAYAMNAFADHYLTDLFSSGHMRTPRKELYKTVTPSTVGSLLARFMHDEDSAYGLNVVNARGDRWLAYGDKRLLDTVNQDNLKMVHVAIQASADEVWHAYQTGTAGTNIALTYVANLTRVSRPDNRGNPSPLFIVDGKTTARRTNPADRLDYSWTTSWRGWSTLKLLSDLPEFQDMGDSDIPVTLDAGLLQLWDHRIKHGDKHHHRLGMIQYGLTGSTFGVKWSTGDVGQGSQALAFLSADFRNTGQTQVLQLWANHDALAMILYAQDGSGSGYFTSWSSDNVGSVTSAVKWLVVDRNGDGQKQVLQCYDHDGSLGMNLFAPDPDGPGFVSTWSNANLGQGPGAVTWLTVDRNGDGRTEILQLWDNHGALGMILYSPDPTGPGYVCSWSNSNLGQGANAVGWIPVDFNGDGKTHVLQCWKNQHTLGMVLYSPDAAGLGYHPSWSNTSLGQEPSAVAWFPVRIGGGRRHHVLQLWNHWGALAMNLYSPPGNILLGYRLSWQSPDLGESSKAVAWLPAVEGASSATNVLQLFANQDKLGMIVYSPSIETGGYKLAGHLDELGPGPGALAFFTTEVLDP